MPIRQFYNQKGITLVELLATISLLAVVFTLASTVLFQTLNSKEKTADQISLTQVANVMISELREQFQNGDFRICYNTVNGLSFPLRSAGDKLMIKELTITNGTTTITENGGCLDADTTWPMNVHITAVSETGADVTMNTTLRNLPDYSLTVVDQPDYSNEVIEEKNDNCSTGDLGEISCNFTGDTSINTDETIDKDTSIVVTDGDAVFTDPLTIEDRTSLSVISENVMFNGDLLLGHKASLHLEVEGNVTFAGDLKLDMNNHHIDISGNAVFLGNIFIGKNNSEITVEGSATFEGNLSFEGNNAKIIVNGTVFCNGEKMGSNMVINSNLSCSPNGTT